MVRTLPALLVAALALVACGSDADTSTDAAGAADAADAAPADEARLVTVSPPEAAATIEAGGDDLVVLDVRTAEEFAEGHIEGAAMIDFYRSDFADQIAELDRDADYVIYCRSGNRSGQTLALMNDLGFSSVEDVGGGVVAWADAGLPLVTD